MRNDGFGHDYKPGKFTDEAAESLEFEKHIKELYEQNKKRGEKGFDATNKETEQPVEIEEDKRLDSDLDDNDTTLADLVEEGEGPKISDLVGAAASSSNPIQDALNEELEKTKINDGEKTTENNPVSEFYGEIDDEFAPTRQKIHHPNRKFKDEEASRFAREEDKRKRSEAIAKSREEKEILNSETRFHDETKKAAHERAANDRVLDSVQGKKEIERAEIKSSEIGLKALAEMSPEAQRAYYEQLADELWALEAELERKPGNQKLQDRIDELKMLRGRLLRERETNYEKTPNLPDQLAASEHTTTGQIPKGISAKTHYLNSQNQVFLTREDALESEAK